MTAVPKLPGGWSFQAHGLAECVAFERADGNLQFVWVDGRWFYSSRVLGQWHTTRATGIPGARTMAEARRVGVAWIRRAENVPV